MRRNYAIHPSVGMRSPTEYERAPDGGADEVSITYDPVMAPFWSWNLRGVSGAITPLGTVGTADVSRRVSFAGEAVAKFIMGVPRRFRWVTFLVSREALRHSRVWGNVVRLPVSVVYDEYQKAIARKRRLSYTPPPRLARAALSANGMSSTSLTSAEPGARHDGSPGSTSSESESLSSMGAHEGMAGDACGTLESGRRVSASSVPIRRNQPSVGELLPGCNPEIHCRVAIPEEPSF
ncbi:hypothetical protein DY000_02014357 [Brassica cretica]|uniref:Uncharacterized protein n=1 Tax=Brassica cretica TaxID=69181 RepID=A0ABQ7CU65_BRACR|nr:hypothetical protein DY000_02014357 [Brassica cretica]